MTERSPLLIHFMLACYVSPEPAAYVGGDRWHSRAGMGARSWLVDNDLVDDHYRATERGKAWVRAICDTPLPIATWSLPARPVVTVEQEAAE